MNVLSNGNCFMVEKLARDGTTGSQGSQIYGSCPNGSFRFDAPRNQSRIVLLACCCCEDSNTLNCPVIVGPRITSDRLVDSQNERSFPRVDSRYTSDVVLDRSKHGIHATPCRPHGTIIWDSHHVATMNLFSNHAGENICV